ncbi:MAG: VWA domain-containing protein [Pseudomonadota bacterium]|nr:VWA domain-containing protein [Pseudomonadota bacterium]
MTLLDDLLFLRPWWLLALLPWSCWMIVSRMRPTPDRHWSQVMDPVLLDALTAGRTDARPGWLDRSPRLTLRLAALLGIVALAGPSWRDLPTPVYQADSARVLVLDLSQSMNAQDLPPSRLARARFAALDLIDSARDGRLAVVAFAGTAHAVVPLTTDHRTAAHLIGTLSPDLMPVPGSAIAAGLRQAKTLLEQGQAPSGDVILLTDSAPDPAAEDAAAALARAGYRLSIVGFGTEEGAPIPRDQGGWVHDRSGRMTLARLDESALQALAAVGGGRYRRLPNEALSLQQLGLSHHAQGALDSPGPDDANQREDAGPWLLLLILPLTLWGFRSGAPWFAMCLVTLTYSDPSLAIGPDWLWRNADQRGHARLENGQAEQALENFNNPRWRGVAAYRAGDYDAATQAFSAPESADEAYNLGNALARSGDLSAAIDAYADALALDPQHEDAAFNKALVERLQQQSSDQSPSDPSENTQESDQSNEPGESSPPDGSDDQQAGENPPEASPPGSQNNAPDGQTEDDATRSDDPGAPQNAESDASNPDEAASPGDDSTDETATQAQRDPATEAEQAAVQQWLRRVPDDPGGLLRNKFLLEQQRREARRQREAHE